MEGERRWDGRAPADAEARATEHPFSRGLLSWGVQARALLAGPAPRRPTAEADCSPEQAGGPLERPELGWSGGRRHGGGERSPFGRAALLVEEQYGTLVAAAVAVVGRAEDGDDVLVVAPRVPG